MGPQFQYNEQTNKKPYHALQKPYKSAFQANEKPVDSKPNLS